MTNPVDSQIVARAIGIQKSFTGDTKALDGVDIAIRPGKVTGLVGPDGAGKTTLIRVLAGLMTPNAGTVDILGAAPAQRLDEIGYMPQRFGLYEDLTVRENLVATARRGHWNLARIYELFSNLKNRENNYGNQLSGGEQQMLAIGRALMTNPRLLILDEATEGLAPLVRAEIWQCLTRLKAAGQSILVIDKNVAALTRIADRHYLIERGRVVWSGTSAELAAAPQVQHQYLGI